MFFCKPQLLLKASVISSMSGTFAENHCRSAGIWNRPLLAASLSETICRFICMQNCQQHQMALCASHPGWDLMFGSKLTKWKILMWFHARIDMYMSEYIVLKWSHPICVSEVWLWWVCPAPSPLPGRHTCVQLASHDRQCIGWCNCATVLLCLAL